MNYVHVKNDSAFPRGSLKSHQVCRWWTLAQYATRLNATKSLFDRDVGVARTIILQQSKKETRRWLTKAVLQQI
jgi:hypothetical protein